MKTMKMSFYLKRQNSDFSFNFFNKDISIIVADIILKFCISVLRILTEGSMSQIFYLGPSVYFM